jgi:hypothetical protein
MAAALPFTAFFYVAVCLLWLQATFGLATVMEQEEEGKKVSCKDLQRMSRGLCQGFVLPSLDIHALYCGCQASLQWLSGFQPYGVSVF